MQPVQADLRQLQGMKRGIVTEALNQDASKIKIYDPMNNSASY